MSIMYVILATIVGVGVACSYTTYQISKAIDKMEQEITGMYNADGLVGDKND